MPSLIDRLLGDDDTEEGADLRTREDDADERLGRRVDPAAYGIDDCAVTGVAVVNEGPDGEPVVVPIARFSLGEDVDSPDYDLVWDLTGEAVRALVAEFDGVFVRHYEVQFTFAGDGLFAAGECRRIAIPPSYAQRLATDAGWGVDALRERMLAEHDIDDDIAPVAWGECKDYSREDDTAVVAGGAAAAAGAGAAGAGCAGAGGGC